MAKINDWNQVRDAVADALLERGSGLVELIGATNTIAAVTCIYMNNDQCRGYGQDYELVDDTDFPGVLTKVSVISAPERLSIITDVGMSYYKDNIPLVGYEDLSEDVEHLLIVIDTVLDRISAQEG
jgi:hypothetical protein